MGVFVILGIVFIFSVFVYIIKNDDSFANFISFVFAGSSLVLTIALFISIINIDIYFDSFINRYNATKNMSDLERVHVINEIFEINKEISVHKAYKNNFLTGIWYSDKIASLEFLK